MDYFIYFLIWHVFAARWNGFTGWMEWVPGPNLASGPLFGDPDLTFNFPSISIIAMKRPKRHRQARWKQYHANNKIFFYIDNWNESKKSYFSMKYRWKSG